MSDLNLIVQIKGRKSIKGCNKSAQSWKIGNWGQIKTSSMSLIALKRNMFDISHRETTIKDEFIFTFLKIRGPSIIMRLDHRINIIYILATSTTFDYWISQWLSVAFSKYIEYVRPFSGFDDAYY
jgi:hypothetical protein